MSYHINIIKTTEDKQIPIDKKDVLAFIELNSAIEIINSKEDSILMQYNFADGGQFDLFWKNGEIWTENPEKETVSAMIEIAHHFDARVRGDELETYKTSEETYIHPHDDKLFNKEKFEGVKIYSDNQRNLNRFIAVAIFFLLGLIISYLI